MKINFIKKTLLLFALSLAIISCDRDDQVGDSELTPTNPNATVTFDFTNPMTVVEDDSEFTFSVTMSATNVVDTKLYIEQVGGDANGDDYEVTGLIVIPAGYTSGSGTIKILEDDLIEDTETLVLQVGDQRTANTSMTPATASFTILNAESGDLVIDMSWSMSEPTFDSTDGEEIDATSMADMRLLITDTDGNILDGADGGSFETYVFSGLNADAEYLVVADFYAAEDYDRSVNLNVEFNQQGVINHLSYDFDNALHIQGLCPENFFVLASFTKMGTNYDVEAIGEDNALEAGGDWTIAMFDSWGDGWNGAFMTVTVDGVATDYSCVGTDTTVVVSVPMGADFSIVYTDGDYEEENSYTITAPDGAMLSDGPNPVVGTVVDSGNICP